MRMVPILALILLPLLTSRTGQQVYARYRPYQSGKQLSDRKIGEAAAR